MLKKSLIFVSAALFLVALITLTGCPTSVDDDDSSGTVYAHRIYGVNVDAYMAQEAIDRAVAAGEPIVLEDGLTISGPGHLNFKNAQVRINGEVEFAGGIVSVVDAGVTWAEGASFSLTGGSYIHRPGQNTRGVNIDALVEYAESLETIMPTATKAGVRRFKLGPKQNFDYSTSANGVDARINAEDLDFLFVLDEIIIDSSATSPGNGLTVTAMGAVDVTGTPADVVVGTAITLGTCSTLTTSKGGVVISVPEPTPTTIIPNIKADKNFIIQQTTAGALTIAGKLTGTGTLEVLGAVTNITIEGGNGSVRFSGDAAPLVIDIASTGTVTFDNAVTSLTGGKSAIAGDVVFNDDVTTAAALELSGNVTLASGAVVNLNSTDSPLTLGAGKTISVRFTPRGGSAIIAPVLTAGPDDVVLTPDGTAGVTLTVPANPTQNNETGIAAAKRLTLAAQDLVVTDGILQIAPEAALAIDADLETDITTSQFGYLAVADGGSLVITANGSLTIGDTVIDGASTLKAGGGAITLGNNKIAGNVFGAVLTTAAGTPVFTLSAANLLTLEQADLNLAANGRIAVDAGARVILTERGKITLNNGEGGVPTTRSKINTSGILSGGFVGLTSPTATTTQAVWSVAHQEAAAADVSIVANAAITLSKSSTTFTAN